jgi:hypothetical protein
MATAAPGLRGDIGGSRPAAGIFQSLDVPASLAQQTVHQCRQLGLAGDIALAQD